MYIGPCARMGFCLTLYIMYDDFFLSGISCKSKLKLSFHSPRVRDLIDRDLETCIKLKLTKKAKERLVFYSSANTFNIHNCMCAISVHCVVQGLIYGFILLLT